MNNWNVNSIVEREDSYEGMRPRDEGNVVIHTQRFVCHQVRLPGGRDLEALNSHGHSGT